MATIQTKRFKELYPTYAIYKEKIEDPAREDFNTPPHYLDNDKMFYKNEKIYKLLFIRWGNFFAVNDDETQHGLMQLALLQLAPALYLNTIKITNDSLDNLDVEKLFSIIERRYNEDADTKFKSTETAYSSGPLPNQDSGSFKIVSPKEKNITVSKDNSIRIKETKDFFNKFKDVAQINGNGVIQEFVNDPMYSSLWVMCEYPNTVQVIESSTTMDDAQVSASEAMYE